MTDRICRHCRHATTAPGNREMYRLGYRNCELLPAYRFVPGKHTCTKWTAKD
jgi:hypothetical protein